MSQFPPSEEYKYPFCKKQHHPEGIANLQHMGQPHCVGGKIRLANWHDGEKIIPVTGVSISGKLSEVLNHIRFSKTTTLSGSYHGPEKAIIEGMNIF